MPAVTKQNRKPRSLSNFRQLVGASCLRSISSDSSSHEVKDEHDAARRGVSRIDLAQPFAASLASRVSLAPLGGHLALAVLTAAQRSESDRFRETCVVTSGGV